MSAQQGVVCAYPECGGECAECRVEPALPTTITLWGKTLHAIGRGKFPYDCISARKHPNAMIYSSPEAGWTHEFDQFAAAAIAKASGGAS